MLIFKKIDFWAIHGQKKMLTLYEKYFIHISTIFNHFKDCKVIPVRIILATDNPRAFAAAELWERKRNTEKRERERKTERSEISRAGKKQAARSSENDSIRSHINLLSVVSPTRGSLLSFHDPPTKRPRCSSFLPSPPSPPPLLRSRRPLPISRSPCHESPGRGINYAPYALAGIPQPVPVFAPLLIRALLSRPLQFRLLPCFPRPPSHPPTHPPLASARLFFLPRLGALWRNLSAFLDGVLHRFLLFDIVVVVPVTSQFFAAGETWAGEPFRRTRLSRCRGIKRTNRRERRANPTFFSLLYF